jgi:hypothetical protein
MSKLTIMGTEGHAELAYAADQPETLPPTAATRRGRLRPAAFVRTGNAGRLIPVYAQDEAERWIARRLEREAA